MQQAAESSFCLTDFHWLGFDLGPHALAPRTLPSLRFADHTLIRYKLPALYQLIYECLWECASPPLSRLREVSCG